MINAKLKKKKGNKYNIATKTKKLHRYSCNKQKKRDAKTGDKHKCKKERKEKTCS